MNDIFDYDFFDDAIEDVDTYDDDYDDAYEDVDMFDENYFEAMEGPARDYRHEQNKGKSQYDIMWERQNRYHAQTHKRGLPKNNENTVANSRAAENRRLNGEGVYGYSEYQRTRKGRGTAEEYRRLRDDLHRYGVYNDGPQVGSPAYNKFMKNRGKVLSK